jgi:hypothetical protein
MYIYILVIHGYFNNNIPTQHISEPISTPFEVYTSSKVQNTGHSFTSDCGQELQVPSFHKPVCQYFVPSALT